MNGFLAARIASRGWSIKSSFIRYVVVGVINTCVGLSVIYTGIYLFGLDDVPANLLGYSLGIGCSFLLNRHWTFAGRGEAAPQLARFLIVMAAAYLINIATVMALIDLASVHRSLAHAAGVVPYTVCGYLGNRFFAFRRPREPPLDRRP